MKLSNFTILARAALASALCLGAMASIAAPGKFDFAYRAIGEADLKPVQIFDDGHKTYLQMKGDVVPAVFVKSEGQTLMLQVTRAGQYLVVPAVASEIQLKFAALSAKVAYTGANRATTIIPGSELLESPGMVDVTSGALARGPLIQPPVYGAAKPIVGDADSDTYLDRDTLIPFTKGSTALSKASATNILNALAGPGAPVKIVVTGRDDQFYVEGMARARGIAIRDRLIAGGVPLDRIVVKEGIARDGESKSITSDLVVTWRIAGEKKPVQVREVAPVSKFAQPAQASTSILTAPAHGEWTMTKADGKVSKMLARWASSEGWNLIWKSGADPEITGDATIVADTFTEAVKLVVKQSNAAGYPFTLDVGNKVLEIK